MSLKQEDKLITTSVICGILLTVVLTVLAFAGSSRAWGCTFVWQACLLQTFIPDNPIHEGTPLDLFVFIFGVLLGVPIYCLLSFVVLLLWQRSHRENSPGSTAQPNKSLDASGGSDSRN